MVRLCVNNNYPQENNKKYKEYFDKYLYPLSDFQKHGIEAIVNGHHSLSCVPTGSGKTLCAEFAIEYFVSQGKRVIYTSPLKALSNEKYYDFTKKYPDISFGIITGDIKANPDAQVLIMTAEILLNTLFNKDCNSSHINGFEMDFDNELACVIMDEIHFINDASRGGVWEQTLMTLPQHIQLVMLSATLDAPEKFAIWIEMRHSKEPHKEEDNDVILNDVKLNDVKLNKQVYLATSSHRIVPLLHYSFIITNQGIFKQIKKDEILTKEIKDLVGKPFIMQSAKTSFNESHYYKMKKMLTLFDQKNVFVKRQHVINEVCKYMVEKDMFPAVLFILSRKQIEIASKEITVPLLEDDSKVPYTIRREAEQILRKLPNYKEYLELPEFNDMMSLLEKGIAMHHSGIIPVLREIVEILFSKGYIKLLLATETFSTGLNMPIKTTIFTSLSKFDGIENRPLYSHEYTQMAGRAGRRGIDTIGHVIHLNNLFKNITLTEYKTIMQNKPQTLVSKFKISYNLLLNLIHTSDKNMLAFVNQSMIHDDINMHLSGIQNKIDEADKKLENINNILLSIQTPKEDIDLYIHATDELHKKTAINKKKKELERQVQQLQDAYKTIEQDKVQVVRFNELTFELSELRENYKQTAQYLDTNVLTILNFLNRTGEDFITKNETGYSITLKGSIATSLREIHCLTFAKILHNNELNTLTAKQLVSIFSCFTNINVSDDLKSVKLQTKDAQVKQLVEKIKESYEYHQDFENENRIDTGVEYMMHYDLLEYSKEWCDCDSAEECKLLLQKMEKEKGIFLGEFVKAILKINNISNEMEKVAETIGNIELLNILREIGGLTLKFVITNQSLYV